MSLIGQHFLLKSLFGVGLISLNFNPLSFYDTQPPLTLTLVYGDSTNAKINLHILSSVFCYTFNSFIHLFHLFIFILLLIGLVLIKINQILIKINQILIKINQFLIKVVFLATQFLNMPR